MGRQIGRGPQCLGGNVTSCDRQAQLGVGSHQRANSMTNVPLEFASLFADVPVRCEALELVVHMIPTNGYLSFTAGPCFYEGDVPEGPAVFHAQVDRVQVPPV